MPHSSIKSGQALRARISQAYGKLPLSFEANRGQTDARVKFLSRGDGYSLFLTPSEAVIVLRNKSSAAPFSNPSNPEAGNSQSWVLRMRLVGGNNGPQIEGQDPLPGKANYIIGNDPARWRTGLPTYRKVRYGTVYPGIDLVYHGNQRQLEYDFVIAPRANPAAIELAFDGARKMRVDRHGDLALQLPGGGELKAQKLVAYQEVGGLRKAVAARYVIAGKSEAKIALGDYDRSQPLIIDPTLTYSTLLGGSSDDWGQGIAADSAGNAYITGTTYSANFPTTTGAVQTSKNGTYNAFVTKLDQTGSVLLYSTYLGGSCGGGAGYCENGYGIAVDSAGYAYVTGETNSPDFPVTAGAFQTTFGGGGFTGCCAPGDAFVTKLNQTGSGLVYSTFLGGSGVDGGLGIAVDAAGEAYVAGATSSTNFPVTAAAFQTSYRGSYGCGGNTHNGFVTKLNSSGTGLVFSTYLGGGGFDSANGISVDASGNAYVTGYTTSIDFPTIAGGFQTSHSGPFCGVNAFVTKFDPLGMGLYSTYLAGTGGDDWGSGIAVDGSGDAHVTGRTNSTDFPVTTGAFQTTYGGGSHDAFVTELAPTGSGLVYSTYLGGSGDELGFGIAMDNAGNAYVTGSTASTNFPVSTGAFQTALGGGLDAFLSQLNPTGTTLLYSTYLGGSSNEFGLGIALDGGGNAYLTGITYSANFPVTTGAYQTTLGGLDDGFVTKFAFGPPSPNFVGVPGAPNCHGKTVSALAQQFGSIDAAAAGLGFHSVQDLQDAIRTFCGA